MSFQKIQMLLQAGAEGRVTHWNAPGGGGRGWMDFMLSPPIEPFVAPGERTYRVWFDSRIDEYFPGNKVRTFSSLLMPDFHPICQDYREPTLSLYFYPSEAADNASFSTEVRQRVSELYQNWETTINRNLLRPGNLENPLRNRYGIFMDTAPRPLADLVLELAAKHGLRITPVDAWRPPRAPNAQLLLMDRSYIYAETFRFQTLTQSAS